MHSGDGLSTGILRKGPENWGPYTLHQKVQDIQREGLVQSKFEIHTGSLVLCMIPKKGRCKVEVSNSGMNPYGTGFLAWIGSSLTPRFFAAYVIVP